MSAEIAEREDVRRENQGEKKFWFNLLNVALGHINWILYKHGAAANICSVHCMVITQ